MEALCARGNSNQLDFFHSFEATSFPSSTAAARRPALEKRAKMSGNDNRVRAAVLSASLFPDISVT